MTVLVKQLNALSLLNHKGTNRFPIMCQLIIVVCTQQNCLTVNIKAKLKAFQNQSTET